MILHHLNPSKYEIFTFTRSQSPINSYYHLGVDTIPRIYNCGIDLFFKFSADLDSKLHIEYVCCKALKTLGFIMRLTQQYKLSIFSKTLYCALVRPIIEYCCVVWDPHTTNDSRQLERVHYKCYCYT